MRCKRLAKSPQPLSLLYFIPRKPVEAHAARTDCKFVFHPRGICSGCACPQPMELSYS